MNICILSKILPVLVILFIKVALWKLIWVKGYLLCSFWTSRVLPCSRLLHREPEAANTCADMNTFLNTGVAMPGWLTKGHPISVKCVREATACFEPWVTIAFHLWVHYWVSWRRVMTHFKQLWENRLAKRVTVHWHYGEVPSEERLATWVWVVMVEKQVDKDWLQDYRSLPAVGQNQLQRRSNCTVVCWCLCIGWQMENTF
jgi:hypothetical protein